MLHSGKDLRLRKRFLCQLARNEFRGVAGIVRAWPTLNPPHRSTLSRWLNPKEENRIPTEQVLPLAGALNIDPFALFETTADAYASLCLALMQKIAVKRTGALGSELEWAHDLIVPTEDWPPKRVAKAYFNRDWIVHHFVHTAREIRNLYQKVRINAEQDRFAEPQVWHFAFKSPAARRPVWTPYGFVKREADRIQLFHFRGQTDGREIHADETSFFVETWFGQGPADFSIASLHPFSYVLVESADPTAPCVRFP